MVQGETQEGASRVLRHHLGFLREETHKTHNVLLQGASPDSAPVQSDPSAPRVVLPPAGPGAVLHPHPAPPPLQMNPRLQRGGGKSPDLKTKKRQNSLMCKWRPDSGLMSSCRGTPNQGSEVSAVGFLCSSQKRQRFGEKRVAMGRPVGTHTHTHAHTGIDG